MSASGYKTKNPSNLRQWRNKKNGLKIMYFKKSKFEQIQGTGQEDLWGREFKTAFPNQ